MSDNRERTVGCRSYSRTMTSTTTTTTATTTTDAPPVVASVPSSAPSSAPRTVALRRLDSPIGRIELVGDGSAVVSLTIERDGMLPRDGDDESTDTVLDRAAEQLAEYFSGTRTVFDVPVALRGTEFQKAVWARLGELKFGEVTSYGDLGLSTGRATAGRAVGGAVGANPVPILVPCHRVLAANSRITGYSGGNGIPTKVWLLDHEGIGHRE
jgi:methylated-DNA-[protein]-cysteine S-methyltransferase